MRRLAPVSTRHICSTRLITVTGLMWVGLLSACSDGGGVEPGPAGQDTGPFPSDVVQDVGGTGDTAGPQLDATTSTGKDAAAVDAIGGGADAAADTGADTCGPEKCNGIDDDCDGQTDELACDDGEGCTEDVCDPASGQCDHKSLQGPCNDGSKCTVGDACAAGICVGGQAKVCDDGIACTVDTCDPETGDCKYAAAADGGACDDGSACTEKDACKAGACVGAALSCQGDGPCTSAVCLPASGCTVTHDDGKVCDDGDSCTEKDACLGGQCKGAAKPCLPNGPCKAASCDAKTGQCVQTPQADITACEDNNPCTTGDFCLKGECNPGAGKDCSMESPCMIGACNPADGKCEVTTKPDGTACSDKNACTSGDICGKGVCVGDPVVCDDKNPCTTDSCDPFTGCKPVPNTAPCDDGNLCTQLDACKDGKCAGAKPKDCDDKLPCTVDSCDTQTGECVHNATTMEGKECNSDDNACTKGDKCAQGVCVVGTAKACDDGKPCTADNCDPKTGACAFPAIPDGGACFDGSLCTYKDTCDAKGTCTGIAIPCKDGQACTADSCKDKTGECVFTPIGTGKACDDGDLCTVGDTCDVKGTCQPGAKKTCNDANPCTNDVCDTQSGNCTFPGFTGPCDDNDACTLGEACAGGACKTGSDGDVTTLAGNGQAGFADGAKGSAQLYYPTDVAVGADGTVYVADYQNHRIRRVTKDGAISTFAGNGSGGFTDGAANVARFYYPSGIAIDRESGTVYVADRSNHRIRRVTSNGTVATLAGSGTSGWLDGNAATARFYYPEGIAVSASGEVWVADTANHRIRRISTTGIVTTVAGDVGGFADGKGAAARFNSPMAIDLDALGNAFVADYGNHRIRVIQPGGVVTSLAGSTNGFVNGQGSQARFYYPRGVAISPAGYLVVGDSSNHRLRKVTFTGAVSTFSGSGTNGWLDGASAAARFYDPRGLDVAPSGEVVVADRSNHRLRTAGVVKLVCDDGNGCTIDSCQPSKGCIFTKLQVGQSCEDGSQCTSGDKCDLAGKCVGTAKVCDDGNLCTDDVCHASTGKCEGVYNDKPCSDGDMCQGSKACQAGSCKVVQKVTTFAGSGSTSYVDGQGTQAAIYSPQGLGADQAGNIYVAVPNHHRIRKITSSGLVSTLAGSGLTGTTDGPAAGARFYYPSDVAVAPDGTVFVADRNNHRIRRIAGGTVATFAGSGAATFKDGQGTAASFYYPEGIAADKQGVLYVADSYNNRIRRITPGGLVTTLAGSGSSGYLEGKGAASHFYRPCALDVDDTGTVYVADAYNHRIRRVTSDGTTSFIAGGSAGFADGVGAAGRFYYPRGIRVTPDGTVFVSDYQNHRIRRIVGNTVDTLSGSTNGFLDGDPAKALFYYPWGMVLTSQGLFIADRSNNRIRLIKGASVECNDGDSCTADSCDPKTGKCSFTPIPNCCAKEKLVRHFNDAQQAAGMTFFTCSVGKSYYAPTGCKQVSGAQGSKGWQIWTSAAQKTSAPGALYYGDITANNFNWGASAGAVRLPAVKLPVGPASLEFNIYFDTEMGTSYDQLKAFLYVDGVKVNVGSATSPTVGAFFQKGTGSYTTAKTWVPVKLDLSQWSNKTVQVEFYFNTTDPVANTGQGVFVDDFKILGACPAN